MFSGMQDTNEAVYQRLRSRNSIYLKKVDDEKGWIGTASNIFGSSYPATGYCHNYNPLFNLTVLSNIYVFLRNRVAEAVWALFFLSLSISL